MSGGNVTVKIDGDQTGANQVFTAAEQRATQSGEVIREKFGIEGLKGEGRVHSQLMGLFRDAQKAGSGMDIAAVAVERLGESFKLALPVMLAFTIGVEIFKKISESIKETNEQAAKLHESLESISTFDVDTASLDEINDKLKEIDTTLIDLQEHKSALDPNGPSRPELIAEVNQKKAEAERERQLRIRRETNIHVEETSGDPELELSAKVQKIQDAAQKERDALKLQGAGADAITDTYTAEYAEIDKLTKDFEDKRFATLKAAADKEETARRKAVADALQGQEEQLKGEADKLKTVAELQARAQEEKKRREGEAGTKDDQLRTVEDRIEDKRKEIKFETDPIRQAQARLDLEQLLTKEQQLQAEIASGAEADAKDAARTRAEGIKTDLERAKELAKEIKAAEDEAKKPSKLNLTEREWRQRHSGGTHSLFSGGAHDIFSNHAIGGPLFGGTGKGAAGAGATDPADVAKQQRATANLLLQEMKSELNVLNLKLMGTG